MFVFESTSNVCTKQVSLCTKQKSSLPIKVNYKIDDFLINQNLNSKNFNRKQNNKTNYNTINTTNNIYYNINGIFNKNFKRKLHKSHNNIRYINKNTPFCKIINRKY